MKSELVITQDGSSSVYIPEFDEHYHSVYGALRESRHVFINAGLNEKINREDKISILEIGFGTGLNALLTGMEAELNQQLIYYTAVEKYPLADSISSQLNFCTLMDDKKCIQLFNNIHSCEWESSTAICPNFYLTKYKMNIEDIFFRNQFDIIYFDAFSPDAQPELWTQDIFESMFNALKPHGILVTYCAKGIVKRTMKNAGFLVETLQGPYGKREMTRGTKDSNKG